MVVLAVEPVAADVVVVIGDELFVGGVGVTGVTGVVVEARQSVLTLQCVQSNVSVPACVPVALPWKTPLASMVTPLKFIHPS